MPNCFYLPDRVTARADARVNNDTVRDLFRGFSFHRSEMIITPGADNLLVIGAPAMPTLPNDAEYIIHADEKGLAVAARDHSSLMRGYCALLQKIEWASENGQLLIAPVEECSAFKIHNRMIHFCVFPETTLLALKRYIRLAGILQYTHVVLEFWGMLRYDCCSALSWPNAFTKAQIAEVLGEIRNFGMEPIPMFNHLGHATASRVLSGKHVVLDQDPSLYPLFTPDGWSFDTDNPKVPELLRQVRGELYDLFGQGSYFHAGLDESYMYANDLKRYAKLPDFLSALTAEISREGRRPMIWMDMFLPPRAYGDRKPHACAKRCPADCMSVLSRLSPDTVLVDWQYHDKEAPIPTSLYLKDKGFDIMGAPWLDVDNGKAHIDTVAKHGLFGVMEITWHTMAREAYKILPFARACGAAKAPWSDHSGPREETATLLRKLTWEPITYEDAGWMKHQITLGAEKEF